jgi:WD40 repeat protein
MKKKTMKPEFQLTRIHEDGSQESAEIVPLAQATQDARMNRRGFFGASLTAAAAIMLLDGCGTTSMYQPKPFIPKNAPVEPVEPVEPVVPSDAPVEPIVPSDAPVEPIVPNDAPVESVKGCEDTLLAHSNNILSLAVSPDGTCFFSAGWNDDIKRWSLPEGALTGKWKGPFSYTNALVVTPDGKTLISGSDDNTIRLWNLPDRTLLKILTEHSARVALAITPDGKTLISCSNDRTIRLWKLTNASHSSIIKEGGDLTSLQLQNGKDVTLFKTLTGHSDWVMALAITPDGKTLISGSADDSIKLWNLPDGTLLKTLTKHSNSVMALAITPDGETLISGGNDKTIRLWKLPDGVVTKAFKMENSVSRLSVSPDGSRFVSISNDSVQLWSLPDARLIKTIKSSASAIAISPDGKQLILVKGKTLQLWDLEKVSFVKCLIDLDCTPSSVKGVTYNYKDEYGQIRTYTLPCGSPIPPGAKCTCNCVPGKIRTCSCDTYQSCSCVGNTSICTCNKVCTCVPVYR